ncbi:hypothetical protein ACJJTC_013327 [Scirpophaga incertulas]
MSQTRVSPSRSQGSDTPQRRKTRTSRSVGSPTPSTSGRLSAVIQFKAVCKNSFILSPVPTRRSELNDNTDIEEPRRRSWWKKLSETSRDVMEVINDNKILDTNEAMEEFIDIEVLSQEKKNYTADLPDSSDNESIRSIVMPQRKLFTQKENLHQKKFSQIIDTRESLVKIQKPVAHEMTLKVQPKNLFSQTSKPRSKPIFPAALLNLSPNKTSNKTKELVTVPVERQARNLFGNRPDLKRKNMFADFILSESEDEISEIQPHVFAFQNKVEQQAELRNKRRRPSDASSIGDEEWRHLPSSTMMDNQLDHIMLEATTPAQTPMEKEKSHNVEYQSNDEVDKSGNKNEGNTEVLEKGKDSNKSVSMDVEVRRNISKELNSHHITKIEPDQNKHAQSFTSKSHNSTLKQAQKSFTSQVGNSTLKRTSENIVVYSKTLDEKGKVNNDVMEQVSEFNEQTLKSIHEQNRIDDFATQESVNKQVQQEKKQTTITIDTHQSRNYEDKQPNEEVKENEDSLIQKEDQAMSERVCEKNKQEFHAIKQKDEEQKRTKINLETDETTHKLPNVSIIDDNDEGSEDIEKDNQEIDQGEIIANNEEEEDVENQEIEDDSEIQEELPADGDEEQQLSQNFDHNDSDSEIEADPDMSEDESAKETHESEQEEKQNESSEDVQDTNKENTIENASVDVEVSRNRSKERLEAHLQDAKVEKSISDHITEIEQQQNKHVQSFTSKSHNNSLKQAQKSFTSQVGNSTLNNTSENRVVCSKTLDEKSKVNNDVIEQVSELNEQAFESIHEQNKIEDFAAEESVNKEVQQENNQKSGEDIEEDNQEVDQIMEISQLEEAKETMEQEEFFASDEGEEDIENQEVEEDSEVEGDIENQEMEEDSEVEEDIENQEMEEDSEVEEELPDGGDEEQQSSQNFDNKDSDTEIEADPDMSEEESAKETQESEQEDEQNENTEDILDTNEENTQKMLNVNSPDMIQKQVNSQLELQSFAARGRNTSLRRSSILRSMNLKPSLAPERYSTGLSDGTNNSSAEGSGWDSHRTTRKTLRQTFGKDFSPRKSLRTLVLEKSAKRQTDVNDLTSVTSKFPQANSTELPEMTYQHDDNDLSNPNHEVSKRTKQTTLELYLAKIKKQNMEKKLKMEEAVRNSLKAPIKDISNTFKVPRHVVPRKPKKNQDKAKAKPKSAFIPVDELPQEVLEDMKYKPPKRFRPTNAAWITKRLYKFLEKKLEPKYDYKARVRAEKLVEPSTSSAGSCSGARPRCRREVRALRLLMARLGVVATHFDFYQFFHDFMPGKSGSRWCPTS